MRILAFLLILCLTLSLTGCWDQVEMTELGLVLLLGIDTDPLGDGFEVTVHILRPEGGGNGEESGQGQQMTTILSGRGQTILDATRNLRGRIPLRLSFHHVRIIVLGEDLARKGIGPVLDFMLRTPEIRLSTYLLVSQGPASELMTLPPEVSGSLVDELQGLINVQDEWSKGFVSRIFDVVKNLTAPGTHPVTARVLAITPRVVEAPPQEQEEKGEPKEVMVLEGSAVFRDDKLVGWLTGTETIGYRYLTGKGGEMVLVVPWHAGMASIQLSPDSSKLQYIPGSAPPRFRHQLMATGSILEYTGVIDFNDKTISQLEALAAQMLRDLMAKTEARAQEMQTDFLGLGGVVSRQDPKSWQKFNTKWRETYPAAQIEYEVKFNIPQAGTISSPLPR